MISIIIVNWNTKQITINCINSIVENTSVPFEIIVIDNFSTDGSQAALEKLNNIKLIKNISNDGFAKANNQGMRIAQGEVVLLLNSDTLLFGNSIDVAYRALKSDPTIAMVGCKLLNEDRTLQRSCSFFPSILTPIFGKQVLSKLRYKYFPFLSTRFDSAYLDEEHDQRLLPDWIMGAFMMVRKDVVEQVGMLDEDYFMYEEDMDWCYRFKKAGWNIVYIPDTAIVHFGGASSSVVPRKTIARHVASTLLFFSKYHGKLASKLYAFVNVIALTLEIFYLLITFSFIDQKLLQKLKQVVFKLMLMCKGIFMPINP